MGYCSICLDDNTNIKLRNCNHDFHCNCIREWYNRSRIRNYRDGEYLREIGCPLCRVEIDERDIPRVKNCNNHRISLSVLMNNDIDINWKNITGDSLLILAVKKGDIDVVEYLLDRGVDIDHSNTSGNTALLWASYYGNVDMVKLLLDMGANIDKVNNVGTSSLMWGVRRNNIEIVEYLLEKGANRLISNIHGLTAKYWANKRGNREICELIGL